MKLFSLVSACLILSVGSAQDYSEAHRPQLHFSPPSHWMNDPNGLVYLDGEYHLFYQYYPDDTVWGPMHWGHAVSPDLLHWSHLPIALYPDDLGYIFSGSIVYDAENTSGLGEGGQGVLVAIFTHHHPKLAKEGLGKHQYQSIAYSSDRGRTWTKYAGNPVLANPGIKDFRDPDVFWHEESESWIMTLAARDRVHMYRSPNLVDWTFASAFGEGLGAHGGVWECPDLFPLPVSEGSGDEHWVLLVSINPGGPNGGSATQYFVGEFDGETFELESNFEESVSPIGEVERAVWLDYGPDNYAGVTYSGIPQSDGRRLFIGWMGNWNYAQSVPTAPWRSAMTSPRRLELRKLEQGLRLASEPIREFEALREESFRYPTSVVTDVEPLEGMLGETGQLLEFELQFDLEASEAQAFGLSFGNDHGESLRVGYDRKSNRYFIDRRLAGESEFSEKFTGYADANRIEESNTLKLQLVLDLASIELFADEGLTVMTSVFFPSEPYRYVSLFAEEGDLAVESVQGHRLRSVWEATSQSE